MENQTSMWNKNTEIFKVLDIIQRIHKQMSEQGWSWVKNSKCKYINLRIDMRDGDFLLMNREGELIEIKDLEYQYGKVTEAQPTTTKQEDTP